MIYQATDLMPTLKTAWVKSLASQAVPVAGLVTGGLEAQVTVDLTKLTAVLSAARVVNGSIIFLPSRQPYLDGFRFINANASPHQGRQCRDCGQPVRQACDHAKDGQAVEKMLKVFVHGRDFRKIRGVKKPRHARLVMRQGTRSGRGEDHWASTGVNSH